MRIFIVIIALLLGAIGFSQPYAQEVSNVYTVSAISVTLPSNNLSLPQLRDKALDTAASVGFKKLLEQITPRHVWSQHVWLLQNIDPSTYVEKFSIDNERTTKGYSALFTVHYKRSAVRDLIEQYQLPFTENGEEKVLVVPLYDDGTTKWLWEEANPWWHALIPLTNATFMLPPKDSQYTRTLTPEMAVFGAEDSLNALKTEVGAGHVIVAQLRKINGFGSARYKFIGTWGAASAKPFIEITFAPAETEEATLASIAQQVQERIMTAAQSSSVIDTTKPSRVFLRFPAQSAADLHKLNTLIEGMSLVQSSHWRLLSAQESVLQVDFFGETADLLTALEAKDIGVEQRGALWRVSLKNTF